MLGDTLLPLSVLILEGLPQPVWVVDERGDILFANDAASRALGYDERGDLEGRPSHATVHHSHADGSPFPAEECRMLRPAVTGVGEHGEDYWFARKDGSLFPISWWSAAIDLPQGRGAVIAFTDITERNELERAQRDLDAARVRADAHRAAQRRVIETTADIRRRTSRDLHDGAQQRLVSVAILLQLVSEQLDDPAVAKVLLGRAAGEAQAAIDDLRELAAGVYPAALTSGGLAAAIDSLVARSPIPVEAALDLAERFDSGVEAHVYFVVAEALTNAVKHARPTRIRIEARMIGDLVVVIEDDGLGGISADMLGSGLLGMQDRVEALGGRLDIDSPPSVGTRITITVPAEELGIHSAESVG